MTGAIPHTAEPWAADQSLITREDGITIAEAYVSCEGGIGSHECLVNARRIAACVNRCQGISTDLLENGGVTMVVAGRYSVLCEQRDKLLAALRGMLALDPTFTASSMELVKQLAEEDGDRSGMAWAVYEARAAIAEVEAAQ